MKRVKAWAVIARDGELGGMGNAGMLFIGTNEAVVYEGCESEEGERVAPVEIEYQEEK